MQRWMMVPVLIVSLMVATGPRADSSKAQKVYDVSGSEHMVQSLPEGFIAGVGQSGIDADLVPAAEALVHKHFPTDGVRDALLDAIETGMDDAQMDEMIAFLEQGAGLRATELENASFEAGDQVVEQEGARIYRELVEAGDPRVAMYQQFAATTRSVENGLTFAMNTSYAMLSGMMNSPSLPYALSDEQILDLVNGMAPMLRNEIEASTYAQIAYTYADLSTEDLEAYVEFLETDAAQAFYDANMRALQQFFVKRIPLFGHDLMVLTGARRA